MLQILREILPDSLRAKGLQNDALLAGTPKPLALESIRVPTLAISSEDDRFLTADAARHIAHSVPGAKLVIYPSVGHVFVGHFADLFHEVAVVLAELHTQVVGGLLVVSMWRQQHANQTDNTGLGK